MKKFLVLSSLALVAGVLAGQTPPGPPTPADRAQHKVQFLTTVLSLTSAQQQQATTIFTSEGTAEAGAHDSMKAAHDALNTAIKNNDSAGIDAAAATIGQLTAQMASANGKAKAAFYQILTADQQAKVSQLEKIRGPGGFGMEHHGPPPMGR